MEQHSDRGGEPIYPSAFHANYALAITLLAYIFSFTDRQILSLLVGPIRRDLAISDFQMSLLQGLAFSLFYVFLGLPIGRLADKRRRTTIIAVGIFLWSLMTAACGLATNFAMLFLARVGVGVGEAALSPPTYSLLSDFFRPERLVRATAIFTLGVTIGAGLAYLVGGPVVELITKANVVNLPIIGILKPWQLTFFVVGLPGLLVALLALTIHEPPRLGRITSSTKSAGNDLPLAEVMGFILNRWRSFGPICLVLCLLSVLGYGTLNWYPTFLIRTYGMSVGDVGVSFGLIYLVFGILGALGGALTSEILLRRGYQDANLRTIMLVSAALLLPAALGPLMPNAGLALSLAAPTVFLLNAFFGASIAALQLVTPNQMRAVNSALFLFANNLTGLTLGSSLVAFLTDFVFKNDMAVRYSLAIVPLIVCPLATIVAWWGLKPYRIALKEAASWQ